MINDETISGNVTTRKMLSTEKLCDTSYLAILFRYIFDFILVVSEIKT